MKKHISKIYRTYNDVKLNPFSSKTQIKYLFSIFLLFIIFGCSTTRSSIEGVWKQKGFGRIMKVENGQFAIYSSTQGYCNQLTSGNFDDHFRIIDETKSKLVINYGSLRNYYFTRIDELPNYCASRNKNQNFDPLLNFNILWNFFNDNYAFFQTRGINWDQIRLDFQPRIEQVTSQREFYQVVKELLDVLDDGHVKLNVPDSLTQQMEDTTISFERIKNEIPEAILARYVDAPKTYNYGTISWGILENTNVGYIVIPRWYGFPNYRLSQQEFNDKLNEVFSADPGPGYEYYMDEKDGVDHVMKEIYRDLSKTDSIVLDLRFNEGGLNIPSVQVLRHCISRSYKGAVKTIKTNTPVPVREDIIVEPASRNVFKQKVCLLTSHWSASASDIFALCSKPSENFSRYGSETSGILSEIVFVVLPNGWEVSMSVDVVTDKGGAIYEVTGIPVDYSMDYPEDELAFYNGFFTREQFRDPLIEKFVLKYDTLNKH